MDVGTFIVFVDCGLRKMIPYIKTKQGIETQTVMYRQCGRTNR